jgi:NAD(P) transhydrogenase subunit alpha
VDLPSRLAPTASILYGNNLTSFIQDLGGAEKFNINLEDEVVRGALVLHNGKLTWPPPKKEAPPAPVATTAVAPKGPSPEVLAEIAARKLRRSRVMNIGGLVVAAAAFTGLGLVAPPAFLSHLTVFALAVVVGWQVIWNVKPALHTPLMSVTNAISGIIVIGGMLQVSGPLSSPVVVLGAVAILVASINVVGGFTVTQRMLRMFHR